MCLHRGFASDFKSQFDDALTSVKKTLAAFDLTLADIAKVNIWLKFIKDLPVMEKLFNNYFEKNKFPARMTATTEFIDDDCLMMIEGIAYRKNK